MKTLVASMMFFGLASFVAVAPTVSAAEADQDAEGEVQTFQASPEEVLSDPADMFQVLEQGKAVHDAAETNNKSKPMSPLRASNDLRACGMKYLNDSGAYSIWEAQKAVYVVVDVIRNSRSTGSTTFTIRPPNKLSLLINRNGKDYDAVRSCGRAL